MWDFLKYCKPDALTFLQVAWLGMRRLLDLSARSKLEPGGDLQNLRTRLEIRRLHSRVRLRWIRGANREAEEDGPSIL